LWGGGREKRALGPAELMKARIGSVVAIVWAVHLLSCAGEILAPDETIDVETIRATTDRARYAGTDTVIVTIANLTLRSLSIQACIGFAWRLERRVQGDWEAVNGRECSGILWPWIEMGAGEEWEQVIRLRGEPEGTYRLAYTLREMPRGSSEDIPFWTNNFTVIES